MLKCSLIPLYPVPCNTTVSGSVSVVGGCVGDSFMDNAIASPSFCICQLVNWTWSKLYQSCQLLVERNSLCFVSDSVLKCWAVQMTNMTCRLMWFSSHPHFLNQFCCSCTFPPGFSFSPCPPLSLSTCEHMWPAQPRPGGVQRRLATAPAPGEGGNSVPVAANLPNSASPKPLQKSRQGTIPKYALYLYCIHKKS